MIFPKHYTPTIPVKGCCLFHRTKPFAHSKAHSAVLNLIFIFNRNVSFFSLKTDGRIRSRESSNSTTCVCNFTKGVVETYRVASVSLWGEGIILESYVRPNTIYSCSLAFRVRKSLRVVNQIVIKGNFPVCSIKLTSPSHVGVYNGALWGISKAQMSMQLNGSTGPVLIPLFGNYSSIVFIAIEFLEAVLCFIVFRSIANVNCLI